MAGIASWYGTCMYTACAQSLSISAYSPSMMFRIQVFIEMRGNHDMYTVPERDGPWDGFSRGHQTPTPRIWVDTLTDQSATQPGAPPVATHMPLHYRTSAKFFSILQNLGHFDRIHLNVCHIFDARSGVLLSSETTVVV